MYVMGVFAADVALAPGSAADWVAAIATGAAFIVAAISYSVSVWEKGRSQARLVYATISEVSHLRPSESKLMEHSGIMSVSTWTPVFNETARNTTFLATEHTMVLSVEVHNGSKELIGDVRVGVVDWGSADFAPMPSIPFSPIPPESSVISTIYATDLWFPGQPALNLRVVFRDADGRWWQRLNDDQIMRAPRAIRMPIRLHALAKSLASSMPESDTAKRQAILEDDEHRKGRIRRWSGSGFTLREL